MYLKQSTAGDILVGPVLDSNGAAYTGMAITDFNLTKNGTSAAMASPATVTHSHNGHYVLTLTTTNTDTLGRIMISANKATYAMPPWRGIVMTANVHESLVGGTDTLHADVIQINGDATDEPLASLALRSVQINAGNSGAALTVHSTSDDEPAILIQGGTGGCATVSTATGDGIRISTSIEGGAAYTITDRGQEIDVAGKMATIAPVPTAEENADAVWASAVRTLTDSYDGTALLAVLNSINAKLTSRAVNYVNTVALDGSITLYSGNDYSGLSALTFSRTWGGIDLTGASVVFRAKMKTDYIHGVTPEYGPFETAGTITVSGSAITVTVELSAEQTAGLLTSPPAEAGEYRYQVIATTADNKTQTLFDGWLTVRQSV